MKKWFIILGIMLLFCSFAYAGELYSGEKGLSNCVQSLNKVLADKRELSGNVEVYLDMKLNHSLNAHKIISYDNKELAELVDDSLKSLEKSKSSLDPFEFMNGESSLTHTQIQEIKEMINSYERLDTEALAALLEKI